jgi:hypothetical protein
MFFRVEGDFLKKVPLHAPLPSKICTKSDRKKRAKRGGREIKNSQIY